MTDQQMKLEATEQIRLLADLACPPDIEDQLIWILARSQIASTWVASTDYAYGQVVRPTVDNGIWFRCVRAGTSEVTEPTWPTYYSRYSSRWTGATEGNELVWSAIPAQPNIYDIRAGVHEAFMLKAGKCTHLVNVSVGNGVSVSAGDLQKQFAERAKQYLPIQIGL